MTAQLVLACPQCGADAFADDLFCEHCGTALGPHRDTPREHVEIDAGWVAGVSDRGLVHRRNEDALFVAAHGSSAVAVVCDGVSASAAAQAAAAVATDVVGHVLLTASQAGAVDDWRAAMAGALAAGDRAVREVPWLPSGDRDPPSSTVVAAVSDSANVTVGWAGDSRAYWLDSEGARQLTIDHSWAQEQTAAGMMSAAAAQADGRAHAITRWLGADAPAGEAAIVGVRTRGPGRLVLCSDGLWNHLATTSELAALVKALTADSCALDVARTLTATALARGGHDNVTVAVLDIGGS